MSEARASKTLEVTRSVSAILTECNIRCMVIGAAALAVHGYARQSVDLDLAIHTNPFEGLRLACQKLSQAGYAAELVTPDGEDPLGGVINVTGADFDPVQIINFNNPLNPHAVHKLVGEILAEVKAGSAGLAVIPLEALIVLKLYAGDLQSRTDVIQVLRANPGYDKAKVSQLCSIAGLTAIWQDLQEDLS